MPDGLTPKEIAGLDSARYAALGNAVTVPVAAWIGSRLVKSAKQPVKPMTRILAGAADLQ